MTDRARLPELLPCPFCGGESVVYSVDFRNVRCNNCWCRTEPGDADKATAEWNRRADLRRESAATEGAGWVSVEERLPKSEDAVLVCAGNHVKVIEIAHLDGKDWRLFDERGNALHFVTHWMPLPAPPAKRPSGGGSDD